MPNANDKQVGGEHYKMSGCPPIRLVNFQHWDMVAHFKLDYFQGQITKYVMRWRNKNGIQDLEKAKHFLEKYIEIEKEREATNPGPGYVNQDRGSERLVRK